MRVRIAEVRQGLHPSEVVVSVDTIEGAELLTIDRRSIVNGTIEVGYPIREHEARYLIELPRETSTGTWRVWVERNMVSDREAA